MEEEAKIKSMKIAQLQYDVQCYQKFIRDMKKQEADKLVTLNYQMIIARQTTEELLKKCKRLEETVNKICEILDYEEVPISKKITLIRKEISKYGS